MTTILYIQDTQNKVFLNPQKLVTLVTSLYLFNNQLIKCNKDCYKVVTTCYTFLYKLISFVTRIFVCYKTVTLFGLIINVVTGVTSVTSFLLLPEKMGNEND